jgi:hypothetical protein
MQRGDRVRVTGRCRLSGYSPGDKGTVARGPLTSSDGTLRYCHVRMDKVEAVGMSVIFTEGEIEPDV